MRPHWQYLLYVLRHKWYVFLECWKLGVPLWASIIHDWQKFTVSEWQPYAQSFHGPWKYKDRPEWLVESFDHAWLHHLHHGPHHWEYWLLQEDDGDVKVLGIPDRYLREMLADWRGAGRAITGKDNTEDWYQDHKSVIKLHPKARVWIEKELRLES